MTRFPLIVTLALAAAVLPATAQRAPLPESPRSSIEYPSPGAAFNALRADPGVAFEMHDGWIVARDSAKRTVWTFAPKDDPAYPAVVKRSLVERNGDLMLQTGVLCGASKAICDDFVRKFLRLNEEMARAVQGQRAEPGASAPAR